MNQKKSNAQPFFIPWRYYLILSFISLLILILLWRVFDLAILDRYFLQKRGNERSLRLVKTPAFRGMIFDRNHYPLAISTTVYSIWANPQEFKPLSHDIRSLSRILGISVHALQSETRFYRAKHREFIYLKRGLAPEVAMRIKSLAIPGLYIQQEYKRYYPEGEVSSHVIGFTNIDDKGQEGLELGFDEWLRGEPGKKWVMKDRIGRIIADIETVQEQKPGQDLILSIDRRIQYLAYRALLEGVNQNQATSGSAIVLDATTGEILAMVNQPSFNPNDRTSLMSQYIRNRAITDSFEPGSTIKAFTVASALASGRYEPNAMIDTSPGWMRVDRNLVKDERNHGLISLAKILQLSSNIGVAKLVLSLPSNEFWDLLKKVGFGEITGVSFPGESSGSLINRNSMGSFVLATLSFGYGLSTTTLQLARAYSILANGGVKLPISLLKLDKPNEGEQVLNPSVCKAMLELLETVVAKGATGERAAVSGYRVAGKTGTSFMVGAEGYEKHHYTSSFVGIAPLNKPRLVVAVVLHNLQGKKHSGGLVPAPIFSKIMEGSLRMLDIPPDQKRKGE